jgi:hypothetical protein
MSMLDPSQVGRETTTSAHGVIGVDADGAVPCHIRMLPGMG